MQNTNIFKNKKGFTLIELLVVISIIGLLSSVVLGSLKSAREKANGAKVITEANQLKIAMEMYRNDKGIYPFEKDATQEYYDVDAVNGLNAHLVLVGKYIALIPNIYTTSVPAGFSYMYYLTGDGLNWISGANNYTVLCGGKKPKSYLIGFYNVNTNIKLNRPTVFNNVTGLEEDRDWWYWSSTKNTYCIAQ